MFNSLIAPEAALESFCLHCLHWNGHKIIKKPIPSRGRNVAQKLVIDNCFLIYGQRLSGIRIHPVVVSLLQKAEINKPKSSWDLLGFQAIIGAWFCRICIIGKVYLLDLRKSPTVQIRTEIKSSILIWWSLFLKIWTFSNVSWSENSQWFMALLCYKEITKSMWDLEHFETELLNYLEPGW